MSRIALDAAPPAVQKFLRSLPVDAGGVELTLGGNVLCKVIPPSQLSDAEKAAQLADVRQLLAKARRNSKHLPAADVETPNPNCAEDCAWETVRCSPPFSIRTSSFARHCVHGRHLLRLKKYRRTRIVTPAQFLALLRGL
jgi:hypothetical protein